MTTNAQTQDLVITRVIDAPLAQVWKAWSDEDQVKQWWGPTGFTCPLANMDFREGGVSLVCMRAPQDFGGQDFYNAWAYATIVPMQEIDTIQSFVDKDGHKVDPTTIGLPAEAGQDRHIRIIFKAVSDNQTELTITEYDWIVGQMMEMSRMGMEQCLDKMAASLASA